MQLLIERGNGMNENIVKFDQFVTISDEELVGAVGGYLPIPDLPGWRGRWTPWWWSLPQSNFSDAYSSFYSATH